MLKICYGENSRSYVVQLNCACLWQVFTATILQWKAILPQIQFGHLPLFLNERVPRRCTSNPVLQIMKNQLLSQNSNLIADTVERKKITICSIIFRVDKPTTVWVWETESATSARCSKYFFKCFENSDALRWPLFMLLFNIYSNRGKF